VITDVQWQRVESGRIRLRDRLWAGEDPMMLLMRALLGEDLRPDMAVEPMDVVALRLVHNLFLGEWRGRGRPNCDGRAGEQGQCCGLTAVEWTSCLERVLDAVDQVAPVRADRCDA
jgi:hypothetical protein